MVFWLWCFLRMVFSAVDFFFVSAVFCFFWWWCHSFHHRPCASTLVFLLFFTYFYSTHPLYPPDRYFWKGPSSPLIMLYRERCYHCLCAQKHEYINVFQFFIFSQQSLVQENKPHVSVLLRQAKVTLFAGGSHLEISGLPSPGTESRWYQ